MRARRPGLLAATLLALFGGLLPLSAGSDDRPTFTVGILRRDGVVIPFATYDGSKWSNRWPAEHATDLPISLADVPKEWWPAGEVRASWTAWLPNGVTQSITASAPVAVKVHCTRRVALRTDFVPTEPPPPPEFQPYPKSGLAVTGPAPVTIERIEVVQPTSAEAKAFAERVKRQVAEAETKRVKAWAHLWAHPVDEKSRATAPVEIEVLAKAPGLLYESTVSYFEAVKRYPGFIQTPQNPAATTAARPAQSCEYLTFAGGWLITGPRQGMTVGADLSNCNREGLVYTLPLGAIRTGGHLFWIIQASSWDSERYDIIEIRQTDTKAVLSVGGGTCR